MSRASHDDVVTYIAANRFPFPGQTTWPADYVTLTNVPVQRQGIPLDGKTYYPDILIIDGQGQPCEIGEVELVIDRSIVPHLRACSDAADNLTPAKVRHFFLYVPQGLEATAQQLLEEEGISYAGLRSFAVGDDGEISIIPFITPGDQYDHQ
jgi:hypothetical protein